MSLTQSQALMIDAFERLQPSCSREFLQSTFIRGQARPDEPSSSSSSSSHESIAMMAAGTHTRISYPASQGTGTRKRSFEACSACRRSKTRCLAAADGVCFRCRTTGRECVFGDTYTQHRPQLPNASNAYDLVVSGQSFGHGEMLCLRAYKNIVQTHIPVVSAFEIRCGILTFCELVHQSATRSMAFACRSAAWAAVAIGAVQLGRDCSCYLDNAIQGLSEYYDNPRNESLSALLAISDASMSDKREEITRRCLSVLDILTYEQGPSSPAQAACVWFICCRAMKEAGLSPVHLGTLTQRFGLPDIQTLPTPVQVTVKIATSGLTMLDTFGDGLSTQDKLRRCSEAYETLAPISRSLPANHLLAVFTHEIQSYFLFRMGNVRMAVDRFVAAVECREEKNGLGIIPLKCTLHRLLLRLVEFVGGYTSVVERSRKLVRLTSDIPWYKESTLFNENLIVSELVSVLMGADCV